MTKACYIIVSIFLLPLLLVHFYSCNTAKQYHRPDIITDSVYYNVKPVDSSNIALITWQNIFSDTSLKKLIGAGIENNLDLKIAIQRIDEAEAFLRQKGAEPFPDLNVETTSGITRQSDNSIKGLTDNKPVANYRVGLSSSWEIDLWGKLRSAKRSAYADLLKTEAIKRSVQTKLIADIATEYYNLLLFNSQQKIIELTIRNREEDLETVKLMKTAALLTEAAVKQSEAQVYAAMILLPKLKTQINISSNAINIFLGKMPSQIKSGDLDDSPQLIIDTLTGYPSQLLINRPDVYSSEQSLIASFENTNVARANFYPSLSITAGLGLESFDLGKLFLFPGSIFANSLGQLVQPIFDKRKNKSELEAAYARQQIEAYKFRNTFLTAAQEVSNALYNYKTSGEIIFLYSKQTEALELALEYSQELLKSGFANYVEVLRAEDELLNSRLEYLKARTDQLQSGVELYRALGGGWR